MHVSNLQWILPARVNYYAHISLFGIAIIQTHLYYINFPKDWAFQRVSVNIVANFLAKKSDVIFLICSRLGSSCRRRISSFTRGVKWPWHSNRILATLNMIFTVHAVYYYLIVNFGNSAGLDNIVWYVHSASVPLYITFIHIHLHRSFKVI